MLNIGFGAEQNPSTSGCGEDEMWTVKEAESRGLRRYWSVCVKLSRCCLSVAQREKMSCQCDLTASLCE